MNRKQATAFAGKRAVVTGAGSGIGKAISVELAARGMFVHLAGRDLRKLRLVSGLLPDGMSNVSVVDLRDPEDVSRFADALKAGGERMDVLVHSAGIHGRASVANSDTSQLDDVVSTNLRGPVILTSLLLPHLCASQGDIVFINSSAALHSGPELSAYAMSKAGLRAFADSLRAEVNPLGVRVLSVFLGRTATPLLEKVAASEGSNYAPERLLQPEDVAAVIAGLIALPPTAETTEIHLRPRWPPQT